MTMQITMNYFAQVRRIAGVESEAFNMPGAVDLKTAINESALRHGDEFRALVLDGEQRIRPSLLVLVNGVPVSREAPCPLKDGDVISLMGAVAGG
jgi:MoaD family protein